MGEAFDVVVAPVAEGETLLAAGAGVAVSPVFIDVVVGDGLAVPLADVPAAEPWLLAGPVCATATLAMEVAPVTTFDGEAVAVALAVAVADARAWAAAEAMMRHRSMSWARSTNLALTIWCGPMIAFSVSEL